MHTVVKGVLRLVTGGGHKMWLASCLFTSALPTFHLFAHFWISQELGVNAKMATAGSLPLCFTTALQKPMSAYVHILYSVCFL